MELKGVYQFNWNDGTSRRTDNLENASQANESAIEMLAQLGREDPECEVSLVGYES